MFRAFPFTFSLSIPGLINPFSSLPSNSSAPDALATSNDGRHSSSRTHRTQPQTSSEGQDFEYERPSRSRVPNSLRKGPGADFGLGQGRISLPSQRMPIPEARSRLRPSFSPSPSPSLSTSFTHLHPSSGSRMYSQSHSPSPAPISRKRGWEPSIPSPSESAATLACTNGYLDTPAKYREMAGVHAGVLNGGAGSGWSNKGGYGGGRGRAWTQEEDELRTIEMSDHYELEQERARERELGPDELPPAKRRRGLAGSIVSTALSAALIGTAVGLTVYRLWRDRGKQQEQLGTDEPIANAIDSQESQESLQPSSPPPPYQQFHQTHTQGGWTAIEYRDSQSHLPTPQRKRNVQATPKSAKKVRHLAVNVKRERPIAHRSARGRGRVGAPTVSAGVQPEFDFGRRTVADEEEAPAEDKMDWIGDKLSQLIEEGKKALGREVVVMSDAKEDEIDDGGVGWVDHDQDQGLAGFGDSFGAGRSSSRSSSMKRSRRPKALGLGSGMGVDSPQYVSSSLPASASAISPNFSTSSRRPYPAAHGHGHSRGLSHESGVGMGVSASLKEDSAAWESAEMRELMEKARAKARAGRG